MISYINSVLHNLQKHNSKSMKFLEGSIFEINYFDHEGNNFCLILKLANEVLNRKLLLETTAKRG